jgi:ABC-type transport system involved in cytochrome bd biosynthesis fused ATPase/permease subunit
VGGTGLLEALDGGLDARVGEGGRRVSAGERQRIALARALLRPASLHLLDEPTAHLDDRTEAAVLEALSGALAGCSALIVTHRPAVIELADRVITLDAGRCWATPAHRMGAGVGSGHGARVGSAGGAPATLPPPGQPA